MSRVLIYGDPHLCSKRVGYHKDYAEHSLNNLRYIESLVREHECDTVICLGDFADGTFSLNYRLEVDKVLQDLNGYTKGNHYTLKGNHDVSTAGLTEYDYYTNKGLIKNTDVLELDGCNIYFANYGCIDDIKLRDNGKKNILLSHDYLVFNGSKGVNPYYKPIYVEDCLNLLDMDLIICGHIHNKVRYTKDGVHIIYPGSSSMGSIDSDTTCYFIILDCDEDNYKLNFIEYSKSKEDLYDLVKYNLDVERKQLTDSVKENITEVLNLESLESYSLDVTNFRLVINGLDIDKEVKDCAIKLLDSASK